ncbi:hypothetical protein BATDEDRAFT_29838 [Batrachochytrium dendrobatidis JAM81]|uniref:UBZ4-type domain-containing protein n=1 Tax=Batrachochytrium dendrobatidis (strain JAM81 / FGSC 10211) TaxID=684364 RepID=F4NZC8_BATDJ|nr:ssDNA-dependent ATPase MGS1 [Batrachochytrium dendrobatidis JAM81]EGF81548.1 hypothetical protein BATDEDRAFT_29838 [Batrachochytrium dendrobatidis JAM81]|eukprot:XP_006677962.1 hypothetical protein BATDEDRAFT_29838 [Batrachochytrium dendrobatidis JAM81]
MVQCPVCNRSVSEADINTHLDASCEKHTASPPLQQQTATCQPKLFQMQTKLQFLKSPNHKRSRDELDGYKEPIQNDIGNTLMSVYKPPHVYRPLADLARPTSLNEFFGHEAVVGQTSLLRQLIESKKVPCMILWGPPGSGKTTLARIIAKELGVHFKEMSATIHNVSDVRKSCEEARTQRKLTGKKSILFLDEIHRFTKAQQDFFLPPVEQGEFTFIAATTENPSFRVNAALLSRCKVFVMDKYESASLCQILRHSPFVIPDNVIAYISTMCDGDARVSINALEMALDAAVHSKLDQLTLPAVQLALSKSHLLYDHDGEEHYNIISALHKSMRGSDADAALYWMGRMIFAGEDPLYVARRLVRFASEDIGLADSSALTLAMSTYQACQVIGMPECDAILAHCVTYLARAPKSVETYRAVKKVKDTIMNSHAYPVPLHLRNAPTQLLQQVGYGAGYIYNPDHNGPVDQEYFPLQMKGTKFL